MVLTGTLAALLTANAFAYDGLTAKEKEYILSVKDKQEMTDSNFISRQDIYQKELEEQILEYLGKNWMVVSEEIQQITTLDETGMPESKDYVTSYHFIIPKQKKELFNRAGQKEISEKINAFIDDYSKKQIGIKLPYFKVPCMGAFEKAMKETYQLEKQGIEINEIFEEGGMEYRLFILEKADSFF